MCSQYVTPGRNQIKCIAITGKIAMLMVVIHRSNHHYSAIKSCNTTNIHIATCRTIIACSKHHHTSFTVSTIVKGILDGVL